jgi:hypothetical protein
MSSDSDDGGSGGESEDRPMFEGQEISKGKRRDSDNKSEPSDSDDA